MLEHARQFFENVLPAPGPGAYLNIHWSSLGTEGGRFWDGRACETVDEAIKTVAWATKLGGKDIYTCMSLQKQFEDKTSAKGNKYRRAMRLAESVASIRSLYIDVDVKEKSYPTTGAALEALKGFLTSSGMPVPTAVVASGSGGFHAHWALDTPLTREEWQPLANALAYATQQFGLICDTQCTVDSARILRVPETQNLKQAEPRPVKLLSLGQPLAVVDAQTILAPYMNGPEIVADAVPFARGKPNPQIAVNDELGAGLESPTHDIKVEDVAKHCAFVAHSIATGGKDNDQPLWFLTASLASFVEEGRDALHSMSDKHPTYTKRETDTLYDRVTEKRKARNVGWPQCEKIASYGCKQCQGCPLLAQKKSPLNFALEEAKVAAADADATMPDRYVRSPDGIICHRVVNDDGTLLSLPLSHYPVIAGWLSNNPWTLHFTTVDQGRKTAMEIPAEVIFAKDGLAKYLGSKGMFCTDKQYKLLKDFFVAWLQKLQNSKDSVVSASPFGWSAVDGKLEGFTYAGRVWMGDSDRPAASPNPVLQYQYTPRGAIEPWREAAKVVYEQKRPGLDAILAVAFAAPLVRFTGFGGLILNAYSPESGIGKTTAMRVSQAVWGSPVLGMQGLDDTANSVLGKMGQLRSIPMYWDEIKSEEQVKRFCSIVFNLTGGREKTRMNSDTTLRLSGTWQTMMVSASNDSLVDGMARVVGSTTAGLHRLFEYQIPKVAVQRDLGSVQRLSGKLDENYGHAGLIYSQFLGRNFKRVEQEVAEFQDRLYSETAVQQEERMWIATMAVVLKGAEYSNELGLTEIDLPGLKKFLMEVLAKMRAEVNDSPSDLGNDLSVSTILAEFINSTRSRNTLVTNRIWVSKGKPPKGAIVIHSNTTTLGELGVHIGRDDRMIRISSTFLTRWMGDRGYSRSTFVKRLEEEFGVKKVTGKLAGGTELSCAMEHLLELDANHPKLSAMLDV